MGRGFLVYNPYKENISKLFDFKLKDERNVYDALLI